MIVIEKDTKKLQIPRGLGMIDLSETTVSGVTREEAREIATEVTETALEDYNPTGNFKSINGNSLIGQGNIEIQGGGATPEEVEQAISEAMENETARTESTYAKPADITAALEDYNPTGNFKSINGNSIIGEGNIEIQGGSGDSNYLIVNSLDEISNPVEGMRAYVNAQYQDYEGVVITPIQEGGDHYAGWMRINEGEEMYSIYYTGEEGNRDWHWDWDNSGQWREREWNGHIIHYQATDTTFNYFFIEDNEPYLDLNSEDATSAATVFTVQVADSKEYIYYEKYGWIELHRIFNGGDKIDDNYYRYLMEMPREVIISNGLFINYGENMFVNITDISRDGEDNRWYWRAFTAKDSDVPVFITFSIRDDEEAGHYYFNRDWEPELMKGNSLGVAKLYSENMGIEGGEYFSYGYYGEPGQWWDDWQGEWLTHTYDNGWKLKVTLRVGGNLTFRMYNENSDEIWGEGFEEWEIKRKVYFKDEESGVEFTAQRKILIDENTASRIGANIYIDVELQPEGELVNSIQGGLFRFDDFGFKYWRTIPDVLDAMEVGKQAQYNEMDIQEIAREGINEMIDYTDIVENPVLAIEVATYPRKYMLTKSPVDDDNIVEYFTPFGDGIEEDRYYAEFQYNNEFIKIYGDTGEVEYYTKDEKVDNKGGVSGIWRGTQAEYDAISNPDANILYVIVG